MRLRRAVQSAVAASAVATASSKRAEAKQPEPRAPDVAYVHRLAKRWTEEEEAKGYKPPVSHWPPRRSEALRGDIAGLRSDLKRCGGVDNGECHQLAFRLAVTYLGSTMGGSHLADGDRDPHELVKGAELMRQLAERGSAEGARGWAYCLQNAEGVEEDTRRAAHFHRKAADLGCAQSMHELGTMHYLGARSPPALCPALALPIAHAHARAICLTVRLRLLCSSACPQVTACPRTARRPCVGFGKRRFAA